MVRCTTNKSSCLQDKMVSLSVPSQKQIILRFTRWQLSGPVYATKMTRLCLFWHRNQHKKQQLRNRLCNVSVHISASQLYFLLEQNGSEADGKVKD